MLTFKEKAYQYCQEIVSNKINRIQNQIDAIKESLNAETKSSAGDKHETGRAMMQLEREKLGNQLLDAEKMQQVLKRIDINTPSKSVRLGSLVKTNLAHYFISISGGKYQNEDGIVFCVSAHAPIAQLLIGKSVGDMILLNGVDQQILQID